MIEKSDQTEVSGKQLATLGLPSARLALETFNVDAYEPLNVDTVLLGMHQWWWNCQKGEEPFRECFSGAIETTLQQHVARHPNRPLHKLTPDEES